MQKKSMDELQRLSVEEFKETFKNNVIIFLENVRSMHNVGSVFRTSDAFLVEEIILTGVTPRPPHRDIHKTALGATESVNWRYEKDAITVIEQLKNEGYKIVSVEQVHNSISLNNFKKTENEKYFVIHMSFN